MSGGVQKGFQRFAYAYSTSPAPDEATRLGIIVNALIGYSDPATSAAFGTGFPQTAKSTAASVMDGLSNTILIDEVAGRNTLYAGPTPILSATAALGANSPVLKEAALGSGGWADQINVMIAGGVNPAVASAKTDVAFAQAYATGTPLPRLTRQILQGPGSIHSMLVERMSRWATDRCGLSVPISMRLREPVCSQEIAARSSVISNRKRPTAEIRFLV